MFFKTLDVRNILLFLTLAGFPACHALAHEADLQNSKDHIFSTGEKIHITVLNEDDLTKNYEIDDAGMILMPLLGKVHVAGLRPSKVEMFLTQYLQDGYILHPVISVNAPSVPPLQSRSFYILGEVENPGRYTIPEDNLNLLNAVALAGGFTYRANKEEFEIMRNKGEQKHHTKNNSAKAALRPGDLIIVRERFF
ncbi:MAG: polysaccharide biosynthesis protein [Alphaproteobacteria bacterium]|nr:MAG: polysaccharide biosynthesis protein [Alphaproteobacteria bacterium]